MKIKKQKEEEEDENQKRDVPYTQNYQSFNSHPIIDVPPEDIGRPITDPNKIRAFKVANPNNPSEAYDANIAQTMNVDVSTLSKPSKKEEDTPKPVVESDAEVAKREEVNDYMSDDLYTELREKIESYNKEIESPIQKILSSFSDRLSLSPQEKLKTEGVLKDISDNVKNLCGVEALVWIKQKINQFFDDLKFNGVSADNVNTVFKAFSFKVSEIVKMYFNFRRTLLTNISSLNSISVSK